MRTAFIIFDRMTALDFIGVYDPLARLRSMSIQPDFEWQVCASTPSVRDDHGLVFTPTSVGESLGEFDLLVVAGGYGTRTLQHDAEFIAWLNTAAPTALKASVCTGSLLLGAAGMLRDKRATTHPSAYDELKPYCRQIVSERVVDEGNVVTAGGVTAAIDLGLHLVRRLAGEEAHDRIARQMGYGVG